MRKIALVWCEERYINYDDSEVFVKSISDWTEVDDETYDLLVRNQYSYRQDGEPYRIVTRPSDEPAVVKQRVADIVEAARKAEAQREADKKKREAAALQKRLKKQAKDEAERRALYDQLKNEFE